LYALHYNQAVFELLQEVQGKDAIVFARSTYASGQRFPVHWGGDCWSTFESMAESLRGGLSLTSCGFAFWSHDIGGFEGHPSPELFMRWAAFGLLSSHSRLHGSTSFRVPWEFGDRATEVFRQFYDLRQQLMPYLLRTAHDAADHGWPVLRAMFLEFPDDPTCRHLDRQYMLGHDLLVAPVMRTDGRVTFYVPAGTWTDLFSGATIEGRGWHTQVHDFDTLPLLARPGSTLPTFRRSTPMTSTALTQEGAQP
ncbi:MAG: alpha-xylosidase, partial [Propionibacteriaceae bacterium]|nr:alpha-xylosidase [Propionibacteriaceae bacterium]